jgi:hypothetical protein
MKNLTVKLFEIYSLQSELNGLINQQTGEKVKTGILDEEISLVAKYWINQLNDVITAEVKTLDTQREELIKKYGTADEQGGVSLQMVIKEMDKDGKEVSKMNPNFAEFNKEFNELLSQEKELAYHPIKLETLTSVTSGNNYPTFFKFVEA